MLFLLRALLPVLLLIVACQSPRKRSAAGMDYFAPEFQCTSSIIKNEASLRYLGAWKFFHDRYVEENKKLSPPFAVITGDSIAHLFVQERLQKFLPEFQIINRGIGGDSTLFFLRRLDSNVIALQPRVVIISIGGNDLLGGRCLGDILENTRTAVQNIRHNLPQTSVILTGVPPVLSWKANAISPQYNRRLAEMVSSIPNVFFLDLWPALSDPEKQLLAEPYHNILPGGKLDTIHFNEKGYAEWARLLRPVLQRLQTAPASPAPSTPAPQ
ncbi:MAG: hypothetical protein HS115_12925 [Spirochaetales bacterium]|nr:hypothetical protein [Spirochaetales bacterium]